MRANNFDLIKILNFELKIYKERFLEIFMISQDINVNIYIYLCI